MTTNTIYTNSTGTEVGTFSISERLPPNSPFNESYWKPEVPSTSSLGRGNLYNSTILLASQNLNHICDIRWMINFTFDLSSVINPVAVLATTIKNAKLAAARKLADLLRDAMKYFRDGINAIIAALSFDPTGSLAFNFSLAKGLLEKINYWIRWAAQKLEDVLTWVYFAQQLSQLINWITSLPAKIQQLLQNCLNTFKQSITTVAKSLQQLPNQVLNQTVGQVTSMVNGLTTTVNANVQTLQSSLSSTNNSMPTALSDALANPNSSTAANNLTTHITTAFPSANSISANTTGTLSKNSSTP